MNLYSNGSNVKCRKLAFCRRRGVGDISRVRKPGGNAKQKLNAGDVGAFIKAGPLIAILYGIRKVLR